MLNGHLHDRAGFACGKPTLDAYLRQKAGQHQRGGITTTHVLADADAPARILGYCSLAAAQLNLDDLQPSDRMRLPAYPVPAVRMARLAVSAEAKSQGYGWLLIGHAVNCACALRETLGVCVLLVDAKDARAAAFYSSFCFRPVTRKAKTLHQALGTGLPTPHSGKTDP